MKYFFENLTRKCGHVENVKSSSIYSDANTVKRWMEADLCSKCQEEALAKLNEAKARCIEYAKKMLQEKGVDVSMADFTAQVGESNAVEVNLWINIPKEVAG